MPHLTGETIGRRFRNLTKSRAIDHPLLLINFTIGLPSYEMSPTTSY